MKDKTNDISVSLINTIIVKLPSLVEKILSQLKNSVLPSILMIGASIIYLFYTNIRLGLVFVAFLMLAYLIMKHYIKKCCTLSKESNETNTVMLENISDLLSNISNVQSFNTYTDELDRLVPKYKDHVKSHSFAIQYGGDFRNILTILFTLLLFTTNSVTYYLFKTDKIPLRSLLTIFIINTFIFQHLTEVTAEIRYMFYNFGVLQSIQDTLDEFIQKDKGTNTELKTEAKVNEVLPSELKSYDISFEKVCVKTPTKTILNDLSLYIPTGQKIGIIGGIGCGKTTLLLTLMRMKDITGAIKVGDCDIKTMNVDTFRDNIAYIQQQPKLFNRSVYENVLYGTNKQKNYVDHLIKKYNLQFIFTNIDMNADVGKAGERLSGGQKQIVALLRCFMRPCHILLLDEITSSLDQELKRHIMTMVDDLMKDKTVIIVTHDTYLLNNMDRIVTLENGKIISDKTN